MTLLSLKNGREMCVTVHMLYFDAVLNDKFQQIDFQMLIFVKLNFISVQINFNDNPKPHDKFLRKPQR